MFFIFMDIYFCDNVCDNVAEIRESKRSAYSPVRPTSADHLLFLTDFKKGCLSILQEIFLL